MKNLFAFVLAGMILPVNADCFNRSLIVSRYHYPNPTDVSNNWQDLYRLDMSSATSVTTSRLTRGAIKPPRRDSSFVAVSPDGTRLIFIESDAGGTAPRLRVMQTVDSDGDLEGDGLVTLDEQGLDIGGTAWGADNRLIYPKLDAGGKTQLASTLLSGTTIGPITLLTNATTYPDNPIFVDANWLLYDADGNTLMHLDLAAETVTALPVPGPIERCAAPHHGSNQIFFASVQGATLDLWTAELAAGPTLANPVPVISTTDRNDTAPAISPDGSCMAFLAADLTVTYGPNSDLWIRDLSNGEMKQITFTRDISGAEWLP